MWYREDARTPIYSIGKHFYCSLVVEPGVARDPVYGFHYEYPEMLHERLRNI